jgi:hypothetical protein
MRGSRAAPPLFPASGALRVAHSGAWALPGAEAKRARLGSVGAGCARRALLRWRGEREREVADWGRSGFFPLWFVFGSQISFLVFLKLRRNGLVERIRVSWNDMGSGIRLRFCPLVGWDGRVGSLLSCTVCPRARLIWHNDGFRQHFQNINFSYLSHYTGSYNLYIYVFHLLVIKSSFCNCIRKKLLVVYVAYDRPHLQIPDVL